MLAFRSVHAWILVVIAMNHADCTGPADKKSPKNNSRLNFCYIIRNAIKEMELKLWPCTNYYSLSK